MRFDLLEKKEMEKKVKEGKMKGRVNEKGAEKEELRRKSGGVEKEEWRRRSGGGGVER